MSVEVEHAADALTDCDFAAACEAFTDDPLCPSVAQWALWCEPACCERQAGPRFACVAHKDVVLRLLWGGELAGCGVCGSILDPAALRVEAIR